MSKVNTTVHLSGLTMKNPVTTGSGTFGSGLEMKDYVDLTKLGAITVKGTTLEARPGNISPRIAETPAGNIELYRFGKPRCRCFYQIYIAPGG